MSTVAKVKRLPGEGKVANPRFPRKSTVRKSRDFLKSPLFGLWKDYPGTVEGYMNAVRQPRFRSTLNDGSVR